MSIQQIHLSAPRQRVPQRVQIAPIALLLGIWVPCWALAEPTSPDLPEGLSQNDWQSLKGASQAGRYAVVASPGQPGTWQAPNPGQQWITHFDARGFLAEPAHRQWQWGMELRSWGFDGHRQTIDPTTSAQVHINGQRTVYQWRGGSQEWFINAQSGLEHGYTVHEPPAGDGQRLHFELTVRGGLKPRIESGARDVHFVDASGAAARTYTGLKAWDADGFILEADFSVVGDALGMSVDTRSARYPITIDPLAQQAYLKASNADTEDYFAIAVAVAGDTVVVGAYLEDSNATGVNGDQANYAGIGAGVAYVFAVPAPIFANALSEIDAAQRHDRATVLHGNPQPWSAIAPKGLAPNQRRRGYHHLTRIRQGIRMSPRDAAHRIDDSMLMAIAVGGWRGWMTLNSDRGNA